MRCLLLGGDGARLERLRRIIRETGWGLIAPRTMAAVAPAVSGHVELAILCFEGPTRPGEIAELRRLLPKAVIVVMGNFSPEERARALALGASDCLPQDTSSRLLIARIMALLRLRREVADHVFKLGPLEVDVVHRRACDTDHELQLSLREFRLLTLLVQNGGRTLTRSELIEELWGDGVKADDNALEVQVSRLRRKLGHTACRIVAVRGMGYRLLTRTEPSDLTQVATA